MNVSNRLSRVRAELEDAQIEFDDAFKAEGFNPVRAEKAQSRLDAAKSALRNALVNEAGELNRERTLANLRRRLPGAERRLRFVEFKLREAMGAVNLFYSETDEVEWIENRVSTAHQGIDYALGVKVAPAKRRNLEDTKARLGEVSYRLTFVKDARHEVAQIKRDIDKLALKSSRQAAA